jgi:hypothetical protein
MLSKNNLGGLNMKKQFSRVSAWFTDQFRPGGKVKDSPSPQPPSPPATLAVEAAKAAGRTRWESDTQKALEAFLVDLRTKCGIEATVRDIGVIDDYRGGRLIYLLPKSKGYDWCVTANRVDLISQSPLGNDALTLHRDYRWASSQSQAFRSIEGFGIALERLGA